MEQSDRDRLAKLEYHISGNGGKGIIQRLNEMEEQVYNKHEDRFGNVPDFEYCEKERGNLIMRFEKFKKEVEDYMKANSGQGLRIVGLVLNSTVLITILLFVFDVIKK